MRIVFWGTYDQERPRNRISINGLRSQGVEVAECHSDAWQGNPDKSAIRGFPQLSWQLLRLGYSYLGLTYRYLRQPAHDAVMVGYLGLIDLFAIWPWAKLRRKPIVWDALMSLYNTLVIDRGMFKENSLRAKVLFLAEWMACRMADRVLVTTEQRRKDFVTRYQLAWDRVVAIPVGVEFDAFPERSVSKDDASAADEVKLLFYGNFLPLHGVKTIVKAAQLAVDRPYQWTLIGSGQTAAEVQTMLDDAPVPNLTWLKWVEYPTLHQWIHRADIGLGIFGGSNKAAETIPNKIYQILATGTPLITRDSPAMRELFSEQGARGVYLIPPENPEAILDAIENFQTDRAELVSQHLHREINDRVRHGISGKRLKKTLREVTNKLPSSHHPIDGA